YTTLQPVTGLGKANFGIKEDGTSEVVVSVEEITAGSDATADIVFVFDVTGSMGDEIEGLKSRAQAFADALAARGVDYRLALVTFGDTVEDVYDFTSDVNQFKNWIGSLSAHGGSDYKENALEGLARAASLSFRAVTQRMSILITDADFHEAGEVGVGTTSFTTESMVAHLLGKGIVNNVVGPDQEPHHQLAEDTGGLFFDITGDFQAIVDLIGNIISSQYLITYNTHNAFINNTWRNVTISATSDSKTGSGNGRYYIGTAISNVSGFYAYAIASDKVVCRWYNPSAESFAGVVVVRKTGSYPTGPADGTVIYEGTGTSCVDINLTQMTLYYYAAFAYNFAGFYSEGGSASRDYARTWAEGTEIPTSWKRQNSGTKVNLQSICAVDSFNLYVVGENGAFLRTSNGGTNWEAIFRPSAPNFFSVDFISLDVGWSVGSNTAGNAENLKTISRGSGWTPWPSSNAQPIYGNDFVNDMMGWNVGAQGKIEKTINGGGSWTAQTSGVDDAFMSVCFINTKTGWTAGGDGTILKTTNSGASWIKLVSGTTSRINDIHFQDAFLGWAVTDNGYLLRTTDGGNAWSTKRLSDTFLSAVCFSDPYNGVTVGGNGKVFITKDGGVNWEEEKAAVESHLRDVVLLAPGNGWAVGDNGTIIKLSSGTVSDCGFTGYRLTISSIDAEAFPQIKIFASVVDTSARSSVAGLGADHFSVQENSTDQSPILVEEMGKSSGARADIAFVFDVTGSMGDEITGLKERAIRFAESLATKGVDYRLALVTFNDEVSEVHDFTDDVNEFKAWIDGLRASGGGDSKENALEGLARAVRLSYRSTTQRIAILITDADYHEAGETGNGTTTYTTLTVINLLNEYGIVLNVVGPDMEQFHQLADNTSGLFYDITGDFGSIVDDIGTFLSTQYVITYTSSNPVPDATLRQVLLTVDNMDNGGCDRGSYYIGTSRLFMSPYKVIGIVNKSFTIDVYVESVLNLGLCNFKISFDAGKIQVKEVKQGSFLTKGGADLNFIPETDNTNGTLEVSATRVNAVDGTSGSGRLCSIIFNVTTSNCAGTIDFISNNLRTPANVPIAVSTSGTVIDAAATAGLLGDFDKDLDIDTRDFALLSTYWKPANNANGDIGPAAGFPPAMTPSPDGFVNFEDLFVFARMWNWFHTAETGEGDKRLAKKATGLQWQVRHKSNNVFADLVVAGAEHLAMGFLKIGFDKDILSVKSATAGDLLNRDQVSYALFSDDLASGGLDITFARLAAEGKPCEINGSGVLLTLELERHGSARAVIEVEHLDLRSADNRSLSAGDYPAFTLQDADIPSCFDLLPNYPNPFNSRTQISFQVPRNSRVKIEIINLLGQPVRTLVDDHYETGSYRVAWDGADNNGRMVVSGIYILRMRAGSFSKTREMLFLK
ncbi:VWA domain-containing protein, partial [candidate division KSB1 bacterium]|nr:VWA domain-containing protein [candidate division KSB1 bacterium]